jgi:hypothetical protein
MTTDTEPDRRRGLHLRMERLQRRLRDVENAMKAFQEDPAPWREDFLMADFRALAEAVARLVILPEEEDNSP